MYLCRRMLLAVRTMKPQASTAMMTEIFFSRTMPLEICPQKFCWRSCEGRQAGTDQHFVALGSCADSVMPKNTERAALSARSLLPSDPTPRVPPHTHTILSREPFRLPCYEGRGPTQPETTEVCHLFLYHHFQMREGLE